LLAHKIRDHKVNCWLVNTGWSGGPYGIGKRMSIKHTRTMLNAALEGKLDKVNYDEDPVFGVQVPRTCPGVPEEVLQARSTWADKPAYDRKAQELAKRFEDNFRQFENEASDKVRAAGPRASVPA